MASPDFFLNTQTRDDDFFKYNSWKIKTIFSDFGKYLFDSLKTIKLIT